MEQIKSLIIPFVGLKEGEHHFHYLVADDFFEQFDSSIIQSADFDIEIELLKKANMLEFNFQLKGEIYTICDRCGSDIAVPVSSSERLIVKFGEGQESVVDEILILPQGAHEVDLTGVLYEYLNVLMPVKVVHEKVGHCDQEVIKKLKQYASSKHTAETDPRWLALAKLKENDK